MTLREWLLEARPRYLERARRLEQVPLSNLALVAFALMTPRTPYERSVRQFREWKKTGVVRGGFAATRAKWIREARGYEATYGLGRGRGETGRLWALRLAGGVKGLGIVKAPFACCLMEPLASDVPVCMDLWMYRALGFQEDTGSASRNEGAQRLVQGLARSFRMPPFPLQWAVWDWKRSAGAQVAPLVVRETDIEEDLTC